MNAQDFLQFGGLGLAGFTIYLFMKLLTNHLKTRDEEFKDVINRNTEAFLDFTRHTQRLYEAIQYLIRIINNKK